MSQALVTQRLGALPAIARNYLAEHADAASEFGAGITGGFAVISYKGKQWAIRKGGESNTLMRDPPEQHEPRTSIELILVRAAPNLSKNYYASGFEEGSTAKPDCWSTNGIVPDPDVPARQNPTCAGCRHNQFGSKVSMDGKASKGKSCADSKRIAVVPPSSIQAEEFGGPLLLRVPAASLQELKQYSDMMNKNGYPIFAVATRVSFDLKEAFPKLVFNGVRALTEEEAAQIVELREDPRVNRILNTSDDIALETNRAAEPEKPALFEQAKPPVQAAAPVTPKVTAPAPEPTPAPVQAKPVAAPQQASAMVQDVPFVEVAEAGQVVQHTAPVAPVPPAPVEPAPQNIVKANTQVEAAPPAFDSMLDELLG